MTHYLPGWVDEDCGGLIFDLVRDAFEGSPYDIECELVPPQRQVREMLERTVDCAIPFPNYLIAESGLVATEKIFSFRPSVLSLTEGQLTLEELKHAKILAFRDSERIVGGEIWKLIKNNPNYQEVPHPAVKLDMLLAGRVDYIIGEYGVMSKTVAKYSPDTTLYQNYQFDLIPVGGVCKDAKHAAAFNDGYQRIVKSGEYKVPSSP